MNLSNDDLTLVQVALECAADDAETRAETADEFDDPDEAAFQRQRVKDFYRIHRQISVGFIEQMKALLDE